MTAKDKINSVILIVCKQTIEIQILHYVQIKTAIGSAVLHSDFVWAHQLSFIYDTRKPK